MPVTYRGRQLSPPDKVRGMSSGRVSEEVLGPTQARGTGHDHPGDRARVRRASSRHRSHRRIPTRLLRKLLFFGLLITASLAAGYVVSRYEGTVHQPE